MSTFALVHGAGSSAADWDLVGTELRRLGHEAVAVDLPAEDDSAGWDAYADTVIAALPSTDDVAVVAHSLGGFPGTLVCSRIPARLLVLVSAMVPRPGERADDWWEATGHQMAAGYDFEDTVAMFLHDVPDDLASASLARERGQSSTPMTEPWPLDEWPDVATRFVLCKQDRFFPPDFVRRMVADRLPGVPISEIDASHAPYLSRPVELAELLDGFVAGSPSGRPASWSTGSSGMGSQ